MNILAVPHTNWGLAKTMWKYNKILEFVMLQRRGILYGDVKDSVQSDDRIKYTDKLSVHFKMDKYIEIPSNLLFIG